MAVTINIQNLTMADTRIRLIPKRDNAASIDSNHVDQFGTNATLEIMPSGEVNVCLGANDNMFSCAGGTAFVTFDEIGNVTNDGGTYDLLLNGTLKYGGMTLQEMMDELAGEDSPLISITRIYDYSDWLSLGQTSLPDLTVHGNSYDRMSFSIAINNVFYLVPQNPDNNGYYPINTVSKYIRYLNDWAFNNDLLLEFRIQPGSDTMNSGRTFTLEVRMAESISRFAVENRYSECINIPDHLRMLFNARFERSTLIVDGEVVDGADNVISIMGRHYNQLQPLTLPVVPIDTADLTVIEWMFGGGADPGIATAGFSASPLGCVGADGDNLQTVLAVSAPEAGIMLIGGDMQGVWMFNNLFQLGTVPNSVGLRVSSPNVTTFSGYVVRFGAAENVLLHSTRDATISNIETGYNQRFVKLSDISQWVADSLTMPAVDTLPAVINYAGSERHLIALDIPAGVTSIIFIFAEGEGRYFSLFDSEEALIMGTPFDSFWINAMPNTSHTQTVPSNRRIYLTIAGEVTDNIPQVEMSISVVS